MLKKRTKRFLVISSLVGGVFVTNAKAYYTSFGGSAGYTYQTISSPNQKNDDLNQAYVIWEYSDKGSHKEWFRVVNSNGDPRGKALFNYLSRGYISTTTVKGYAYYLQASREHITNPSTYVSGRWES